MKTFTIDLYNYPSVADMTNAMKALMQYPGWTDVALDEWIQVATVSPAIGAPKHMKTTQVAAFEINVKHATETNTQNMFHALMKIVAKVNKRSGDLVNAPILKVTPG